jgi:hypothetical protein
VEEFQVRTGRHDLVTSTFSFDELAFLQMQRVSTAFTVGSSTGLVRHAMFVLQHELDVPVKDQLLALDRALLDDPERFELLRVVMWGAEDVGVLPLGMDELVRSYFDAIETGLGRPLDIPAELIELTTRVQEAVLAKPGVKVSREVELPVDYVSWWRSVQRGRAEPLLTYGPGVISVEDVEGLGGVGFRPNPVDEGLFGYELASPVRWIAPVKVLGAST